MGSKKLLGEDEKKSLFFDYHHYIIQCIRNDSKPVFNDFYDLITSSDKTFGKYTQKQLSNKIIDFRKIEGSEKWPSFSQAMEGYFLLPETDLQKLYENDSEILKKISEKQSNIKELVHKIYDEVKGTDSIRGLINRFILRIRDIHNCKEKVLPFVAETEQNKKQERVDALSKIKAGITKNRESAAVSEHKLIGILYEYINSMEQIKDRTRTNYSKIIAQSLFYNLFSTLDAFTGELLVYILSRKNEYLLKSNKSITVKDILDNKDSIIDYLIEEEIDSIRRESYVKQFDKLAGIFSVELNKFNNWSSFVEITQRRNIMMHCDGKISQQYLQICTQHGTPVEVKPGDQLDVDSEYLEKSIEVITEVIFKLGQTLWRKSFPNEIEHANEHIIDICFDSLTDENWVFTISIADYGLNLLPKQIKQDAFKKLLIINKALALKALGKFDEAKSIIKDEDFSSAVIDFKMAREVILGNKNKAFDYLRRIGKQGEFISEKSYLIWPLFNDIRSDPDFAKLYNEIYGKNLIEELESGIVVMNNSISNDG
jgi:hypothetical protein